LRLYSTKQTTGDEPLRDLHDKKWIYLKGFLFLLIGVMASAILIIECPTWKVAAMLALAVWCFARFYYFAFYVIEHYVDDGYKFSGLWSFIMDWWHRKT
jgi:hypothetical protein